MADPRTNHLRIQRLLKEWRDANNEWNGVYAWADPTNLFKGVAVIIGPRDTPYEGGCFVVSIQFSAEFPFGKKSFQVLTKIVHCNSARRGWFACAVDYDDCPVLTISHRLMTIQSLLYPPQLHEYSNSELTKLFQNDKAAYDQMVKDEVGKCATLEHVVAFLSEGFPYAEVTKIQVEKAFDPSSMPRPIRMQLSVNIQTVNAIAVTKSVNPAPLPAAVPILATTPASISLPRAPIALDALAAPDALLPPDPLDSLSLLCKVACDDSDCGNRSGADSPRSYTELCFTK